MKNILLLIFTPCAILFSTLSYGQSCDTLRNYNPADQFSSFSGVAGYVPGHETLTDGTNFYNVTEWAEPYNVTTATEVRRLRFAPFVVEDGGGNVVFNVYADNAGSPGAVLGSETIALADIDNSQYNILDFSTPVPVNGNFFVGFTLTYSNPTDTIGLITTQTATNFTQLKYSGIWSTVDNVYTDGTNSLKIAWVMDVLTSTGPDPVADFTVASNGVCLGNSFQTDATNSSNASFYEWYLTDNPLTTVYDDDTGLNGILTPTVSGLNQSIYLFVEGNCKTDFLLVPGNVFDPAPITVGTAQTICEGEPAALTASGSGAIEWFEGATSIGTGTSISVTPTTTTTYEAVLTDANGCEDSETVTVTVNPTPTIVASADNTICEGTSETINASGGNTYTWDNGLGSGASHTVSPITTTTYVVTGTGANGCENTDIVTITVTPLDDASFSYSSNTLCLGGTNETPTTNATGTFSVSPAGLVFANTNTGEIDLTASSANTYTVTYNTSGACPNSSTETITLTSSPDATFTYNPSAFCISEGPQTPVFPTGASAGSFSASPTGLTIAPSTGNLTLSTSVPGTYTVTNTIAASGSCPQAQETFTVEVYPLPTVSAGTDQTLCENHDPMTLAGTPAGGTYSGTGVTGTEFDPGTAGVGVYTITYNYTDPNGCEGSATVEITVEDCASIDKNEAFEGISIMPNPATDYIDVVTEGNNKVHTIQVISAQGRIVKANMSSPNANTTRIDVSNTAKGTYFIQIETSKGQVTKKVIVQ